MPDIILGTASAEHIARFINAMCSKFGYRAIIDGEPNPETKQQFAQRKLRRQLITWTKQQERQAAINAIVTDEIDIT